MDETVETVDGRGFSLVGCDVIVGSVECWRSTERDGRKGHFDNFDNFPLNSYYL